MFTPEEVVKVQEVFCLAMRAGLSQNPPKGTIAELPGSKTITFEHDEYRLVDCWFTVPESPVSWGFILIWRRGILVWTMNYHGQYPQRVISFLKSTLRFDHKAGIWSAGRGTEIHEGDDTKDTIDVGAESFDDLGEREFVQEALSDTTCGFHIFDAGLVEDISVE